MVHHLPFLSALCITLFVLRVLEAKSPFKFEMLKFEHLQKFCHLPRKFWKSFIIIENKQRSTVKNLDPILFMKYNVYCLGIFVSSKKTLHSWKQHQYFQFIYYSKCNKNKGIKRSKIRKMSINHQIIFPVFYGHVVSTVQVPTN